MSFDWKTLPELRHAAFDEAGASVGDSPLHAGALSEELIAARDGKSLVVPLADRGWIRCIGAEALTFLHNQLTSDINHLVTGGWQHSSWCSAKGRMLASFIIAKPGQSSPVTGEDCYKLQVAGELQPAIAKRLKMYVLRAKVRVEIADNLVSIGLAVTPDNARRVLAAAGLPHPGGIGSCATFAGGWVAQVSEHLLQVTVATDLAAETFSALAKEARPAGLAAWHWLEIQAGLPMVRQATQEEFVPQMVNFDKNGGVSFHKGCYPGQEIVARTQYLGKVKRHLYRVHADAPLAPGMSLNITDVEGPHSAGVIANAAASPNGGYDALAVILESAIDSPIHTDRSDGPVLSSIALVAA